MQYAGLRYLASQGCQRDSVGGSIRQSSPRCRLIWKDVPETCAWGGDQHSYMYDYMLKEITILCKVYQICLNQWRDSYRHPYNSYAKGMISQVVNLAFRKEPEEMNHIIRLAHSLRMRITKFGSASVNLSQKLDLSAYTCIMHEREISRPTKETLI